MRSELKWGRHMSSGDLNHRSFHFGVSHPKRGMSLKRICLIFWVVSHVVMAHAMSQTPPKLMESDRIRLAEAFRIGEEFGDEVWKGWKSIPFSVLLITEEYEFLIRHPQPSAEFKLLSRDPLLKSDIYFRKREHNTDLLASFPINGVPTIVTGRAENTRRNSTSWVATLLHEHFHQLQFSKPDYSANVSALDLAGGDSSGMWMLDYAFPYTNEKVAKIYKLLASRLFEILRSDRTTAAKLDEQLKTYLIKRRALKQALSPSDYRYFSLQIWQEGIARYTDHRITVFAARRYKPTSGFRNLKDFEPFANVEREVRLGNLNELKSLTLPLWKRSSFYSLGAGEGLLLDKIKPNWRISYFSRMFYLEKYFE